MNLDTKVKEGVPPPDLSVPPDLTTGSPCRSEPVAKKVDPADVKGIPGDVQLPSGTWISSEVYTEVSSLRLASLDVLGKWMNV